MKAEQEFARFTDAVNTGIRKAAQQILEQARNFPAPCGCTPKVRCDRHCRVKIRLRVDDDGRAWVGECNGGGRNGHVFGHTDSRVWCLSLPALHKVAAEHIMDHRTRNESADRGQANG
jgi:hypothetical protein